MTTYDVELVVPPTCEISGVESGDTATIEVAATDYILATARAQGIWLPADCQQGWCTTCAAELVEGTVDQSDATRYYDVDRDADFVLPCTAKPRSNVRLRVCKHEQMLAHRADHDLPPGRSK